MKLGIIRLAAIFSIGLIAACSSSSGDPSASNGNGDGNGDAGSVSNNKDSGAGTDAGGAHDSGSPTGIDAGAPAPLPPFEFVLNGTARTLTNMSIQLEHPGGIDGCDSAIEMTAEVAPLGAEDADPAPSISLNLFCVSGPASGIPYGTEAPGEANLQFDFSEPSAVHAIIADGPGLTVIQDGTGGTFEMSAEGTFEIEEAPDTVVPFTLKLRQSVN